MRFQTLRSFPPRQAIEGIRTLERFYELAASGQVSVDDFDHLHSLALDSLRTIADIARSYPLTTDQDSAIRDAQARLEQMTVPMTGDSGGTPWWAWALAILAGAGAGAGIVALLSPEYPASRARMSGMPPATLQSNAVPMLVTMAGGSVIGLVGNAYKETPVGALALGAGSSVVGVSLTLLLQSVIGKRMAS